ncbi:MAG TPA: hypothetical protein VNZ52_08015, partial [Candidatus Thermoplasmatota archaeon]|nr:hypothetical protein [Candidatus Thermoplasmatota archaeon]
MTRAATSPPRRRGRYLKWSLGLVAGLSAVALLAAPLLPTLTRAGTAPPSLWRTGAEGASDFLGSLTEEKLPTEALLS